jgi:ABC-type sulfate transport system substrate-binding protein
VNAARPVLLMTLIKPTRGGCRHGYAAAVRAGGAAQGDDEDDLKEWVKKVVDELPALTDGQRDLIALIFRSSHRR